MTSISFRNDYSEGAHPHILERLIQTNLQQEEGYGEDNFCVEAKDLILQKLGTQKSDIHFVSGGTQANLIFISSVLKPYESVIACTTGHIVVHETGAIEATGHKINTVQTNDGKLTPYDIQPVLDFHTDEHMVKPRLVYISNSTETGSIYSKAELTALSEFCREKKLLLYMDGARLASALTSKYNDLVLADLAILTDAFYIGGTKNGALIGEAIVINNQDLTENFRYSIKQKGALLAKGRILGIQFLELFENELFFELGRKANMLAEQLSEGIENFGYQLITPTVSNQVFPVFPNNVIEKLSQKFGFYIWSKIDEQHSSIRLVTSWASKEESVDLLIKELQKIRSGK